MTVVKGVCQSIFANLSLTLICVCLSIFASLTLLVYLQSNSHLCLDAFRFVPGPHSFLVVRIMLKSVQVILPPTLEPALPPERHRLEVVIPERT